MTTDGTPQQPSTNPAETYDQYFVPAIFARWAPLLIDRAAPKPGERVLDVACGTGIVARMTAPRVGEEGRVVGLDISPGMLSVARAHPAPDGATIEWEAGAATALPYEAGSFDVLFCQQGFQFFPDRAAAAREMRRVLAPGGRAALSVWQTLQQHPLYEALLESEARHLNLPPNALARPYSLGEAELRSLLDAAGFARVDIAPVSRTVQFQQPERFVTLTLLAAAAVLPETANLDSEARSALVAAVSRDTEATLREYVNGDTVSFPMHAHVALAYA